MSKLTLRAGHTFWFDYHGDPPARHVFEGGSFTIDAKDFALFEVVGTEILEGELPESRPPKFTDRIITKAAEVAKAITGRAPAGPVKYPCPKCASVFNAERGLEIHIFNAHKDLAEEMKAAEIDKLRANDKAIEEIQSALVAELRPETRPEPGPINAKPIKTKTKE